MKPSQEKLVQLNVFNIPPWILWFFFLWHETAVGCVDTLPHPQEHSCPDVAFRPTNFKASAAGIVDRKTLSTKARHGNMDSTLISSLVGSSYQQETIADVGFSCLLVHRVEISPCTCVHQSLSLSLSLSDDDHPGESAILKSTGWEMVVGRQIVFCKYILGAKGRKECWQGDALFRCGLLFVSGSQKSSCVQKSRRRLWPPFVPKENCSFHSWTVAGAKRHGAKRVYFIDKFVPYVSGSYLWEPLDSKWKTCTSVKQDTVFHDSVDQQPLLIPMREIKSCNCFHWSL